MIKGTLKQTQKFYRLLSRTIFLLFSWRFLGVYFLHIRRIRGWMSLYDSFLLYVLSKHQSPASKVIEIGSYCGRSTVALSSPLNGIVYSVDPHTGDISEEMAGITVNTYDEFCSNIKKARLESKVQVHVSTSDDFAHQNTIDNVSLLFIDGYHSTNQVMRDVENYLPFLASTHTVVFDDFGDLQVAKGINAVSDKLPPFLVYGDKILAFSNDPNLLASLYIKSILMEQRIILLLGQLRFFQSYGQWELVNTLRRTNSLK